MFVHDRVELAVTYVFGPKKPWSAATFTANIELLSGAFFFDFLFFKEKIGFSRSTRFSKGAV